MRSMNSVKLEAIGPRGEACIILMHRSSLANGQSMESYTLATGDRLRATETPGEFTTVSGTRTFRLRNPVRFQSGERGESDQPLPGQTPHPG